jgi:hypothetical protein
MSKIERETFFARHDSAIIVVFSKKNKNLGGLCQHLPNKNITKNWHHYWICCISHAKCVAIE